MSCNSKVFGYWRLACTEHAQIILSYAKRMRSEPTPAERALWVRLRRNGVRETKFYRQKPMGYCIPDFICLNKRIVIEVDGGYHQAPAIIYQDAQRDRTFAKVGYTVLRFTNAQVINDITEVVNIIANTIDRLPNRPHPFPTEELVLPDN